MCIVDLKIVIHGDAPWGSRVVKALGYKLERTGIDSEQ